MLYIQKIIYFIINQLIGELTYSGFGEVGMETSFWLGLEPLHRLTSSGGYTRMRVEMYANDTAWYSAEYDHFSVGNEDAEYRLSISGYSGDAGDQMWMNDNQTFSTNDYGVQSYLAMAMQGGWWYSGNDYASLNGGYEFAIFSHATGFYWNSSYPFFPPPEMSSLVGVRPGRLLVSRIMVTRP